MIPRASGAYPALILRQFLEKYRPNQKPQIITIVILTFATFQSKFSMGPGINFSRLLDVRFLK
jgi:hypothetical protein